MDTSKLPDIENGFTGGVLIFSGRPDPAWGIDATTASSLLAQWEAAPTCPVSPPQPPPLGYRGSFLAAQDGRTWVAHGGAVTLTTIDRTEHRLDADNRFEQSILATAPAGLLEQLGLAFLLGQSQ